MRLLVALRTGARGSGRRGLAQTRRTLRAQMQASALMDEAGFAREVEDAYAQMFARWCASQG
eukprot:gene34899-43032_t